MLGRPSPWPCALRRGRCAALGTREEPWGGAVGGACSPAGGAGGVLPGWWRKNTVCFSYSRDRNCPFEWKDAAVDDGYRATAPVGSYEAGKSPYGAYDMAGNVWEWVADWYDAKYYRRSPARNPRGPTSGTQVVLRSGSWLYTASDFRTTERAGVPPRPQK